MIYKTYKGSRLNLEFYQGKSTIGYEIEVLNDDGSEFDLTVYSSVVCQVRYRKHGELIVTPTLGTSGNFLLLDLTKAQSAAVQNREYFYECYGVTVTPASEHELICFGIFKVI